MNLFKTKIDSFLVNSISILFYVTLSFFHWIERDYYLSIAIGISFFIISLITPSFKKNIKLISVLIVTHVFLYISRTSTYLAWPLDFYIATFAGILLIKYGLKESFSIKKMGWSFHFSKNQLISIAIINIPAIFILILYYSTHKEVAQQWPFPPMPLWLTPIAILIIAAINGLREEIYYRGLLQTISYKNFPPWFSVTLQASLFGSLHFIASFPQGWIGVGLTALWGAAIAIQYQVFRSIALAWITHAMADAIMFTIIICNL